MRDFWKGEIFGGYKDTSLLRQPRRTTPTLKHYQILSFSLIFSQKFAVKFLDPKMAIQTVSKPAGKVTVSRPLSASDNLLTTFETSQEEQMNLSVPFTALCMFWLQG